MKQRLSEVSVGSCYVGKSKKVAKKIEDGRTASFIGSSGRVSMRAIKGDPDVDLLEACPLKFLGVGLRRHPDMVVEIGDGNILRPRSGRKL
jgi:hypothetical protein